MSKETLKSGHGYVPKLTEENQPIWKQKIRWVLTARKAYNIVISVEPLSPSNGVALHTQQEDWQHRAKNVIALIYVGCCDELLPLIDDINIPMEMWKPLRDRLDNASMNVVRTQVLRKFTASRPLPDDTVTQDFNKLMVFPKKLIGSRENITDDTMKTHIFTTLYTSYEMIIQMLEQWIPAPMGQQCMDAIREYAERTALTKEIGDASTRAAVYSRGENCSRGDGGRGGGRWDGRENGHEKHKYIYCKMENHTTKACGKR